MSRKYILHLQQTVRRKCIQVPMTLQPYTSNLIPPTLNYPTLNYTYDTPTLYVSSFNMHQKLIVYGNELAPHSLSADLVYQLLSQYKLFPINWIKSDDIPPNISLLLEVARTPAVIINPRIVLVAYTDDLSSHITSNQQAEVLGQKFDRIYLRQDTSKTASVRNLQQTRHFQDCFRMASTADNTLPWLLTYGIYSRQGTSKTAPVGIYSRKNTSKTAPLLRHLQQTRHFQDCSVRHHKLLPYGIVNSSGTAS